MPVGRVGLIADTHGLLRGDVGSTEAQGNREKQRQAGASPFGVVTGEDGAEG